MTNEEKALEIVNTSTLRDPVDGFGIALKMAQWKEQQMIEKACEWLKENAGEHIYFDECDNEWYDAEELIEDFKKAMMEE